MLILDFLLVNLFFLQRININVEISYETKHLTSAYCGP